MRGGSGDLTMNEPPATRIPAGLRLPFDPLLALAAIGLMAASIISLNETTGAPGDPRQFAIRRGSSSRSASCSRSSSAAWTTRGCAS